jgi:hypothetical protein
MRNNFNNEQRAAFDTIIAALDAPDSAQHLFYLDGDAGTGKSYVENALLLYCHRNGYGSLACASTGIASTLLIGGRTAHSTFGIPIDLTGETRASGLPYDSPRAQNIREANLIIIDEITMMKWYELDFIDQTIREMLPREDPDKKRRFGGKVILLSGDFKQFMPVVERGTDIDSFNVCIKHSNHWQGRHFRRLRLTINQRIRAENQVCRFMGIGIC